MPVNSTRPGGLRTGRILLASSFIFVAFLLAAISFATGASSGWSIVASPNAIGAGQVSATNRLYSVTCTSATNCWAVGVYYNSNAFGQTLIEQWNGNSWTVVSSPNNTPQSNGLNGVTCASASQCWAVGYSYDTTQTAQGLIEQWDGASWTVASVNGLPAASNYFQSVTCPSASECWAVGYSLYSSGGPGGLGLYQTLIAQWNGSSWTVVLSPNTNAMESNLLWGVTCASATNCWAVGYSYSPNDPHVSQSLIEQWNGVSWAIVPSPTVSGSTSNELLSVTCASTTDCWGVGIYVNPFETALTLIEHWNGSSWVVIASPNAVATENNVLSGVTCTSASECWAVGFYVPNVNFSATLIEQWNGTAWSIATSPNPGFEYNYLNGVTCNLANNCWAVGSYDSNPDSGPDQTLIENYAVASPTPTPSPTPTATPSQTVSMPNISPNGGTFRKKVTVKLSCATAGALIHYTTDGSDPTASSPTYSTSKKFKGIKLTGQGPHTVKAMATASGFNNSTLASAAFTIN